MHNVILMQVCGADTPYLSPEKLQELHVTSMAASISHFNDTPKMGGEKISLKYKLDLEKKIEESYESFVKRNESKHILNAYRTPGVLGVVMVLSYLLSSIMNMVGVESLSQMAIFGLYVPLLLLLLWMYIRYSGEFREVGQMIDNITTAIWDQVRCVRMCLDVCLALMSIYGRKQMRLYLPPVHATPSNTIL